MLRDGRCEIQYEVPWARRHAKFSASLVQARIGVELRLVE